MIWKTKFEEKIAILETKIHKLERDMNDTETKSSFLKKAIDDSIWEISKLQTEAEVNKMMHKLLLVEPSSCMECASDSVSTLNCRLTCH